MLITKNGNRTVFTWKGIRIEVDSFKIVPEPNRLGGKYFIGDAVIKDATIHIDGQLRPASIMDHFTIEAAMKDLDDRSFGKSTFYNQWK